MEKKSTVLDVNSSAVTVQTWIDNYVTLPSNAEVTVFLRKTSDALAVEDFNNIVYIRIKKE